MTGYNIPNRNVPLHVLVKDVPVEDWASLAKQHGYSSSSLECDRLFVLAEIDSMKREVPQELVADFSGLGIDEELKRRITNYLDLVEFCNGLYPQ